MHFMTGDLTNYDTYFPYTDFTDYVWYGDIILKTVMPAATNSFRPWDRIFVVLNLVCEPSLLAETTDWANSILAEHNTARPLLLPMGILIPREIIWVAPAAGIDVWNNIVKHHDNVIMVLCGHHSGQYYGTDVGENGNTIYNFLTDYTYLENGGNAYG